HKPYCLTGVRRCLMPKFGNDQHSVHIHLREERLYPRPNNCDQLQLFDQNPLECCTEVSRQPTRANNKTEPAPGSEKLQSFVNKERKKVRFRCGTNAVLCG